MQIIPHASGISKRTARHSDAFLAPSQAMSERDIRKVDTGEKSSGLARVQEHHRRQSSVPNLLQSLSCQLLALQWAPATASSLSHFDPASNWLGRKIWKEYERMTSKNALCKYKLWPWSSTQSSQNLKSVKTPDKQIWTNLRYLNSNLRDRDPTWKRCQSMTALTIW